MINNVVLVGRLTKAPELKYTNSGTAVTNFIIAVNRNFTNSQGEREADFISCILWRKAAENFIKFTGKGSLIGIEGRIQTSSYDNNQGQHVFRTDVIVESFSLLEPKSENDKRNSNNGFNDQNSNNYNNSKSYNNQNQYGNNQSNNSSNVNISDDQLPF